MDSRISLFYNPKLVIALCKESFIHSCIDNKNYLFNKGLYFILILINWLCLSYLPLINIYMSIINTNIYIYFYWVFMGIISSIGLGSGINTGVLVLFPFIYKTCIKSIYCGNTDFDLYGNNKFNCRKIIGSKPLTMNIFSKVYHSIFFWGLGTAIGEIPPFFIARKARIMGENINIYLFENKAFKFINDKVIYVLRKYTFYTILFFASWPNAFFDACGLASGYYLIQFNTFFIPTFIGKALIKAPLQGLFIIVVMNNNEYVSFLPKSFTDKVNNNEQTSLLFYWNIFIMISFSYFIKSTIEYVAKEYQKKLISEFKGTVTTHNS